MPAPSGNQFWKARSSHGRSPIYSDPEVLKDACEQYFQWVEENPLWENKVSQYQGVPVDMPSPKMRAMTISGMCMYIGISDDTWANYRNREDFIGVIKAAERAVYVQKFSGAAADLLNANIIARDLGLKDTKTNEHVGPGGGPVTFESFNSELTAEESSRRYLLMMKGQEL